jgi:ribosomal protein S18 acetylase RimI-like enzyme
VTRPLTALPRLYVCPRSNPERSMQIRPFRQADTNSLYDICLRTYDAGGDAAHLCPSYPRLPAETTVGPCLRFDPTIAFVLEDESGEPMGYAVGVLDSSGFYRKCEAGWWPPLRERYPDAASIPAETRTVEECLRYIVHHPVLPPLEILNVYPSHLHINLLPAVQGRGQGRALLEILFSALAAAGSPGVFLGVQPANTLAMSFYKYLGFVQLSATPGMSTRFGLKLPIKQERKR